MYAVNPKSAIGSSLSFFIIREPAVAVYRTTSPPMLHLVLRARRAGLRRRGRIGRGLGRRAGVAVSAAGAGARRSSSTAIAVAARMRLQT